MTVTRLFDIGGSGIKTANLKNITAIENLDGFEFEHYTDPDWENFAGWAYSKGFIGCKLIGISCAGFIENNQIVKLFRVGGWNEKPLIRELQFYSPESQIFLLNDAEAHLMAHIDLFENALMSISLGTSVGFSICNKNGKIIRPLDDINFDIGELSINTRASNTKAWWALGSNGLTELIDHLGVDEGVKHFGNRLGAFIANICSIFRPKTVVLSGGITQAWWDKFNRTMFCEFDYQKPDWLLKPKIVKSPFSQNAALIGIAKYVASKINIRSSNFN